MTGSQTRRIVLCQEGHTPRHAMKQGSLRQEPVWVQVIGKKDADATRALLESGELSLTETADVTTALLVLHLYVADRPGSWLVDGARFLCGALPACRGCVLSRGGLQRAYIGRTGGGEFKEAAFFLY